MLEYVQKQKKSTNQKVDKKQDTEELNEFREYLRKKQKEFYSDFGSPEHPEAGQNEKPDEMEKKKKEVLAKMKQLKIVNINSADSDSDAD